MSKSQKPVILITGASRGIGRAVAQALSEDWRIVVGGRSSTTVQPVVDSLPDAEPFIADLSDSAAVAGQVAKIDRLDAVVHSSGLCLGTTVAETPREEWSQQFEMNVVAVVDLTRMLLPLLRQARGHVIAINSGSGFTSKSGNGSYSASKFALRAFTNSLREEERGRLRVTSIHPGKVDTQMQVELQARQGGTYSPADYVRPSSVAAVVKLALETTEDAVIETVEIRPSGLR